MEAGSADIIVNVIIILCFIGYDSTPSKYTNLEESFVGFRERCLVRFAIEKSPLHTILYGGTGTGKTYFIRHYLNYIEIKLQLKD